ncbi:MAG: methyl-accepting chemotaxis protein [Ignavibacteria bacterium]
MTTDVSHNEESKVPLRSEPALLGNLATESMKAISRVLPRIGSLNNDTEKQFLTLGQNLQDFYKSSKEITMVSMSISDMVSEEVIKTGIEELSQMLHQISKYLSDSAQDIQNGEISLQKIVLILIKVIEELSAFKRIVKHLRMLGISTRIESARLMQDDGGFNTLAGNVENLSSIINEKALGISEKATRLSRLISQATSKIIALENKQREQTELILDDIRVSLSALNSRYQASSGKVSEIARKAGEISNNVGRVVTSIQFHDITRQQIEHVSEALEKTNENLYLMNKADESKLLNLVVNVHDNCHLQSLQLRHAGGELNSAVEKIIKSLDQVSISVEEVLSGVQEMLDIELAKGGSTIITEIESGFTSISSALSKNSDNRKELTASMKSVADTVNELTYFVNEIDEIGSEIELIALNARIKAAHTGTEGAALGVLAESIQRLSNDAKLQTNLVSEVLTQISESAGNLYTAIEFNSTSKSFIELNKITLEISGQIEKLSSLDKKTTETLNGVRNEVVKLSNNINSTISGISVHHDMSQAISLVTDELDSIAGQINRQVDPALLNKADRLSDLNKNYTMNSERKVHQHYLKTTKGDAANEYKKTGESRDEDLGDNIVLF